MEYYNSSDEIMIVTAKMILYDEKVCDNVEKIVTKTVYPNGTLQVVTVISAIPVID